MRQAFRSAALAAVRAGWVPLSLAEAVVDGLAWLRSVIVFATCDECARRAPLAGRHGLLIHLHTGRVNVVRQWGFCSPGCRERWLAAGSGEDLHPIAAQDAPTYDPVLFDARVDGEVMVSVIFDDGPGRGAPGVAAVDADGTPRLVVANGRLVAAALLASPAAVNAWWRAPFVVAARALPAEMRTAA